MSVTCLYHADCVDGFTAAWLVELRYQNAKLIPVRYGNPLPIDLCHDEDVYMVDFCGPLDEMRQLRMVSRSLHVFDHHATHRPIIEQLKAELKRQSDEFVFSADESGAMIVHKALNIGSKLDVWDFVRYVSDNDTGQRRLENTSDVIAYIASFPFELRAYDEPADNLVDHFGACVEAGKTINRDRKKRVESHMERAYSTTLDGLDVYAVNCSDRAIMSTLTHDLAIVSIDGVGACWWDRGDGKVEWRLTSLRPEEAATVGRPSVDVSMLAKKLGGGGHKHAAGFTMSARDMAP